MGNGEIIYWHRERRPQLLSGQTRPIGTGQKVSRTPSDYEREGEQVNGYCIDCGEEYQLEALNLDLRCADCVEQWALDTEGASV